MLKGLGRLGIAGLIDEATGYQEVRDKQALQALLDTYLRKELAAWAKRFPDEFYEHIFRLRGWQWKGRGKNPPQAVAGYTKDIVYDARLAPQILEELEKKNPVEGGRRKAKHHQWLTEDVGHPALAQHLHLNGGRKLRRKQSKRAGLKTCLMQPTKASYGWATSRSTLRC
jgi:hypothetical protein